jgi:hypothetical protein
MTKKEITDKLDAYGVQYDPEAHVKTLEKQLNEHEAGQNSVPPAGQVDESHPTTQQELKAPQPDVPEPKPRGTGSRYRSQLSLRFADRTEAHNYYLTIDEANALEAYVNSVKAEAGDVSFILIYRNEKPVSKITGFVSEEQAAMLTEYLKVGTM